MEKEFQEYTVFNVTARDGSDVELAVVDEFELDKKHYVAAAVVKNEEIDDSGRYIYRIKMDSEDFEVEEITDAKEYEDVVKAYQEMED